MFEIKDLSFHYQVEAKRVEVLKNLNFLVKPGEFVGIQGPSGSGKSTLFYILGFLLKPTSGGVYFDGIDITSLSNEELTLIRNKRLGFVFQQFHLLAKTNTLDNILLPTLYPSEIAINSDAYSEKAKALANTLGIGEHLHHLPNQLSGGQQQRVAIARALMNDIDLILADEPTGNLDSVTSKQILDLLCELNRQGKTIILITHDAEVAKRCSKVYHLRDGAFTDVIENYPMPEASHGVSSPIPKLPNTYSLLLYQKLFRSLLPLVFKNLLRNRMKSVLTMLGVVIGVAAVLVTVTLGEFAKQRILETYEVLGVNKLLIRGYPNWNMKATDAVSVNFKSFNWENDIIRLKEVFPEITLMSPSLDSWRQRAFAGGIEAGDGKVAALGVTPEYLTITNRVLQAGRNINPYHVEARSPVCVIGYDIAKTLFLRISAIGQIVTITNGAGSNYPCQVIGVLAPSSSNEEWAPPNLQIMLPFTYFQTVSGSWWDSQIHEAVLRIDSNADIENTGKSIRSFFEQRYGKSGRFSVDSNSTLVAQMKKFLNIFGILLVSIAILSLVVGGIGINNMMLVSVTERIKEFGIRKALGATDRSIRIQVLMESMILCAVAGVLGVVFGFTIYEVLIFGATKFVPQLKFEWVFEPLAAVLSLFSIVAVGIASGFIPALKAEKLQVIEALRSE